VGTACSISAQTRCSVNPLEATSCEEITTLADRGYFNGEQVLACEGTGVLACIPETLWPSIAERGFFTRQDFIFGPEEDRYTCPAGAKLTRGSARSDRKDDIDHYRHVTACSTCPLKPKCTPDKLKKGQAFGRIRFAGAMCPRPCAL
jgi:hypothetical protein